MSIPSPTAKGPFQQSSSSLVEGQTSSSSSSNSSGSHGSQPVSGLSPGAIGQIGQDPLARRFSITIDEEEELYRSESDESTRQLPDSESGPGHPSESIPPSAGSAGGEFMQYGYGRDNKEPEEPDLGPGQGGEPSEARALYQIQEGREDEQGHEGGEPVAGRFFPRPLTPLSISSSSSPSRRLSGASDGASVTEMSAETTEKLARARNLVDAFCASKGEPQLGPYRDAMNAIAEIEQRDLTSAARRELEALQSRLNTAAGIATPRTGNWRRGRGDFSGQGSGSRPATPVRRHGISLPSTPEPQSPLHSPGLGKRAPDRSPQANAGSSLARLQQASPRIAGKDDKSTFNGPMFRDALQDKGGAVFKAFEKFCDSQFALENLGFLEKTERYLEAMEKFDRETAAAILGKIITQARVDKPSEPGGAGPRQSNFGFGFAGPGGAQPRVTKDDFVNISDARYQDLKAALAKGPTTQAMKLAVTSAREEFIDLIQRDRWRDFVLSKDFPG